MWIQVAFTWLSQTLKILLKHRKFPCIYDQNFITREKWNINDSWQNAGTLLLTWIFPTPSSQLTLTLLTGHHYFPGVSHGCNIFFPPKNLSYWPRASGNFHSAQLCSTHERAKCFSWILSTIYGLFTTFMFATIRKTWYYGEKTRSKGGIICQSTRARTNEETMREFWKQLCCEMDS